MNNIVKPWGINNINGRICCVDGNFEVKIYFICLSAAGASAASILCYFNVEVSPKFTSCG